MKKMLSFLLAFSMLFAFIRPVSAADNFVSADPVRISVGFFNSVSKEYILPNRVVEAPGGLSIAYTAFLLTQLDLLDGCAMNAGRIVNIIYTDEEERVHTLNAGDEGNFYVKKNGVALSDTRLDEEIADGDIYEWVYAPTEEYEAAQQDHISVSTPPHAVPNQEWTEEMTALRNAALGWLNLNADENEYYIISVGSAGKTADIEAVNRLVANVRRTSGYDSPMEIARRILMLSYCGYDAGNSDLSGLLSELMEYENLESYGVSGLAEALLAYDCRNYTVPNSASNNRDYLVRQLLSLQGDDGGFISNTGQLSNINATAAAIIALSAYTDSRDDVREAVERAVDYLADRQETNGEFLYSRMEDSESLSNVILALACMGISQSDERFYKDGRLLTELLLEYQNADGGFSRSKGEGSNVASTERAVIALSAVRRNSSPFYISAAVQNTVTVTSPVPVQVVDDGFRLYALLGGILVGLAFAAVITAYLLKRKRNMDRKQSNDKK